MAARRPSALRVLLTFGGLGPPVGAAFVILASSLLAAPGSGPDVTASLLWDTLVYGYTAGLVPALLTGLAHWLLAARLPRPQLSLAATPAVGAAVQVIAVLAPSLLAGGGLSWTPAAIAAAGGAAIGLICSVICSPPTP